MRKGQRFTFERLESRFALAGNVTAVFSEGSLRVTGDGEDNAIRITQESRREFTIAAEDGTTTINGGSGPVTISGVRRDVRVRLNGGNDVLFLGGEGAGALRVERDLRVDLGGGDNEFRVVSGLRVGRDFDTRFRHGDDLMLASGVLRVSRDMAVTTGDGVSRLFVHPESGVNSVGRDLTVRNGFGPDYNDIRDTNVGQDVLFDSGDSVEFDYTANSFSSVNSGQALKIGGNVSFVAASESSNSVLDTDVAGDISAELSSPLSRFSLLSVGSSALDSRRQVRGDIYVKIEGGAATVSLGDLGFAESGGLLLMGDLNIATGIGNDGISFGRLEVRGETEIGTGISDDFIFINDSVFRSDFTLSTGRGVDQLLIEQLKSSPVEPATRPTEFRGRVNVELGAGDDLLRLGAAGDDERQVRFSRRARFNGGSGIDRLDAANFTAPNNQPSFENFELVGPPPDGEAI